MHSFLLSLSSEFYKTRKTLAFFSAILIPLILCTFFFILFFNPTRMDDYNSPLGHWLKYSSVILGVNCIFLLPLVIIFQCFSINNIEHRDDMWKILFSLPIPRWSTYSAKFFYLLLLNGLYLSLLAIFIIISATILDLLKPEYKFNEFNFSAILFKLHLKLFLVSTSILSIQFLLSLVWSDFLKPMGIGLLLTVFGVIAANLSWEYAFIIPYSHPMITLNDFSSNTSYLGVNLSAVDLMSKEIWFSLAVAGTTYIIGYFVIRNRSIK